MGYVYTCAERVVVWLGKTVTEGLRLTLGYMKRIAALDPNYATSQKSLAELFEQIREGEKKDEQPRLYGRLKDHRLVSPTGAEVEPDGRFLPPSLVQ